MRSATRGDGCRGSRAAGRSAWPGGRSRWASQSQVKPTPPWIWMLSPRDLVGRLGRRRPWPSPPPRPAPVRRRRTPRRRSACRPAPARCGASMSAALCLIAWNVAIGRSNCTRTLAYSTARSRACCIDAEQLGAQRDRARRRRPGARSRCGRRRVRPARPACRRASSRATLRVTSTSATSSPRGCSITNVPRPSCVRAGTSAQSAPCAVEHHRLDAGEQPAARLAAGPRADAVDRRRRGRPPRGPPCRAWAGRERRRAGRRGRAGAAASVASTADDRNGPGNGSRPISSSTTTSSTQARARARRAPRARAARPAEIGDAGSTARR